MKKNKKWKSRLVCSAAILSMMGAAGFATPVFATPEIPYISTNAVSDNTSDRTITLWKYEIKSSGELGERGDGHLLDPGTAPSLVGKTVMPGVQFEIVRVVPNKDGNGNFYELTDPTKQVAGTHYTVDATFTPITQTTGANGATTFNVGAGKAADGIYLIREVPDANGDYWYTGADGNPKKVATPVAPFFAWLPQTNREDTGELIYDVHVYPKNIVNDTALDKTVEGQKGHSIKAGQSFDWEAQVTLPTGLYFEATEDLTITNVYDADGNPLPDISVSAGDEVYANYFNITDTLVEELHLDDVKLQAFDGTDWSDLVFGTDYTVSVDGAAVTTQPVTKANGSPTKVLIELTQTGMKKVEGTYTDVRAVYTTHTDVDFNGVIVNEFESSFLIPGQKPITTPSENNPEYFDGGFTIDKTSEDNTVKLAGAEFHLATSAANAAGEIFLASNGESYALTATLPGGVTFLTSTSDANGVAHFDGLAVDWFTDTDGDGFQDGDEPTWNHADIERDYWLVETKSPEGYELLKEPVRVTVKLNPADVTVHVENKSETLLPFTGGTGTMLVISLALTSLLIGTVTIVVERKRRHA